MFTILYSCIQALLFLYRIVYLSYSPVSALSYYSEYNGATSTISKLQYVIATHTHTETQTHTYV